VPVLEQVLEKYPREVKLVFKNFPLRNHQFAQPAAIAALAAHKQDKFWEFHDLLFKNYKRPDAQKVEQIARQLGLDLKQFEKDQKDPQIKALIRQDLSDASEADVRGTPAVYINGKFLRNRSLPGFQDSIEKELKKVKP
jgi:protein-disulfide isomerase